MAEGVIRIQLQAVSDAFGARQLQSVVVAVRSCFKLRHCSEARISGLSVGEGREASVAYGLISIDLHLIVQLDGARSDILHAQAAAVSELLLHGETPLQEIGHAQGAI